jgi:hypothetical protein
MGRVRLSLNGAWEFFPDPGNQFTQERLPERGCTLVVPGSWEREFPGNEGVLGRGWYRRTIEIPATWREQAVFLRFGAVNYYCQVWVNGQVVGEHEGGYTPFAFRVDPVLKPGEPNTIVVKVVHPGHAIPRFPDFTFRDIGSTFQEIYGYALGEIPIGKQNWYGSCSGIWQEVYLEAVHPTFFVHALVAPDIDRALASVRIGLHEPPADGGRLQLCYEILDGDNRVVGRRNSTTLAEALAGNPTPERPLASPSIEIAVDGLRLWSLEDPHLYRLRVVLEETGVLRDELTVRFGMRKIEARQNRIYLNGQSIYVMGALDQDFYPETNYTPPSDDFLADQIEKAQHMGLNLLRCHIKAPDPRYLDLADERGILVWEELPNWLRLTEQAAQRGRETITHMIERDFNHPSLVIWTIINESWGADLVNRAGDRKWLKSMYHYVKKLDPTRLVVDNSPCNMPQGRNFHLRTDLEDFHIYFAIPDHAHKWASWVKDFATHPSWTFSYHGDAERTGQEPLMVSEFGNWGLPTLKDMLAEYGEEEPPWFRTGADETQPHGVQRRFARYHLDEIFGSYDQFAIATQWHQYFALKYEIETMRKYASIVGYVITEFTDLHWEANGLLNIWRRPKVFYDRIGRFQQQDVVFADWQRLNYWEGNLCQVDVVVSHFSALDLTGCQVDWNVSELGVSGTITDVAVAPCEARCAGSVSFVVPPIDESMRVRLHVRLRDREGKILARNTQLLSFFPIRYFHAPRRQEPLWVHDPFGLWELEARLRESGYNVVVSPETNAPGPKFAIVSRLDRGVAEFLEAGGSVLYLVHSAEEAGDVPELKNLRIRNRRARLDQRSTEKNPWEGDWVTNFNWLKHEPLFDRIPRTIDTPLPGDLMDSQYYKVIPNQVMLGWSQAEDFNDLFCGMVVGWIHSPAAILAQCRWGQGRLLVTTLKLESAFGDDPVATILLQNLIRYLTSSRFQPTRDIRASRPRRSTPAPEAVPAASPG